MGKDGAQGLRSLREKGFCNLSTQSSASSWASAIHLTIIALLTAVAATSIMAGLDKGAKLLAKIYIGIYISSIVPLAYWNGTLATYHSKGVEWG